MKGGKVKPKAGYKCGGKTKMAAGGGVKTRGCGAATKGTRARGPMA